MPPTGRRTATRSYYACVRFVNAIRSLATDVAASRRTTSITTGSGSIAGAAPTADRTAEVRTEPILSPVQTRHPARGRTTAIRWNGQLPRTARLRALRLILRKPLPTPIPTRSLASTGVHPANATPSLESAPQDFDACRSLPMHTADTPLNGPAQVTGIPFRAQPVASAHCKQLSIPIPLPR